MLKKGIIALLLMGIGFLCTSCITVQQKQTIGDGVKLFETGYDNKMRDFTYDHKVDDFATTNTDIKNFILLQSEGAFMLGPAGVDYYKTSVANMILTLQRFTDEMEQTSVPKQYKQAHEDLLQAYQNFFDAVTVYQKALNKDGITTSNIEGLFSAYPQITLASEKWYTLYKKGKAIQGPSKYIVIGNLQDRWFYINSTQSRIEETLGMIKSNLLPRVEKKDNNSADKMQHNLVHHLPSVIFYMKIIQVPESFSTAHQHLLSACENFYNFIKDTQYQQNNEEYQEKLKGCYEDIEKAWKEWKLVEGEDQF
ncbi:hypothetical protein [Neobacillus vireti]|uniref:Lipoprotein n=1 Tax=Neobacillus vireti LMG 21834 TaxID=1131730 RepID=A0AB94IMW8_9BACI|nr:hypothetical protein [Neobacillus vireti]ETI68359.1 hypothetical protein BAVI_12849 [Neobacillus vireti LMG 21834]KLT16313.1 hypothetical protein AA980_17600 [Neobacillus vireti]